MPIGRISSLEVSITVNQWIQMIGKSCYGQIKGRGWLEDQGEVLGDQMKEKGYD